MQSNVSIFVSSNFYWTLFPSLCICWVFLYSLYLRFLCELFYLLTCGEILCGWIKTFSKGSHPWICNIVFLINNLIYKNLNNSFWFLTNVSRNYPRMYKSTLIISIRNRVHARNFGLQTIGHRNISWYLLL